MLLLLVVEVSLFLGFFYGCVDYIDRCYICLLVGDGYEFGVARLKYVFCFARVWEYIVYFRVDYCYRFWMGSVAHVVSS